MKEHISDYRDSYLEIKLGNSLFFFQQYMLCKFSACYLLCYISSFTEKDDKFFFFFRAIEKVQSARRRKILALSPPRSHCLKLLINFRPTQSLSFQLTASKDHLLSVLDFQKSKLNLEVMKVPPLLRLLKVSIIKSNYDRWNTHR